MSDLDAKNLKVVMQELIDMQEKQISKSLKQITESNYFDEQKMVEVNGIVEHCRQSFKNVIANCNEKTLQQLTSSLEQLAVIDAQWDAINEQRKKAGKTIYKY